MTHGRKISVTGLGYVGLPVAVAFAKHGPVIGYDVNAARIAELRSGNDRTNEVAAPALRAANIEYTTDPETLAGADFHVIAVPTPVDAGKHPDLGPLERASHAIGGILKRGDIVVYESTVYPGATEEFCVPILEARSGLRCGKDFGIGYSPERINPGDRAHTFEAITKVVSGGDQQTCDVVERVYAAAVPAGVYRASCIRVAEAAKVIENAQRDLNIAFMNELAMLLHRLGIDTGDVLRAASTKWNFLPFSPGLVGGHCIGVDPYYLTQRAEAAGYTPRIILAGRSLNDGMAGYVAERVQAAIEARGGRISGARIVVLGFTFKENIPDTRNTAVAAMCRALTERGAAVQVHDPLADRHQCLEEYGISIVDESALQPADGVVFAVAHAAYRDEGWTLVQRLLKGGSGVVFDVKGILDRATCPAAVDLQRL